MSGRRPSLIASLFACFIFLSLLAAPSVLAQGQGGGNGGGNGKGNGNGKPPPPAPRVADPDTIPPIVVIDPSTGDYSSPLDVTIYWCDEFSLNSGSRLIKYGFTDITSSFTYEAVAEPGEEGCISSNNYKSEGTITLVSGTRLTASISDWWNTTSESERYYVLTQNPATVTMPHFNGDNRDRSLCLTAGAGEAAAYQCGDLLVSHSMPGYATKGRDRSLTLVYNSEQASPKAVVTADVGFAVTDDPTTVEAELWVDSGSGFTEVGSAVYPGSWKGKTYQVSVGFDASDEDTGLYPFKFIVKATYSSTTRTTTVEDSLMIVNRSESEFGAGWSLAGVERLIFDQPNGTGDDILWVGGDGSAKRYRELTSSTWEAAAGAFRDTITLAADVYTRKLKHGVEVQFNSAGEHTKTINRVGDETVFTWANNVLTSIEVPVSGATTGDTYTLAYTGTPKVLDKITDPASRILNATVTSGELRELLDPDSEDTDFLYDSLRITKRTNRRGVATEYKYDNGWKLTEVKVPLDVSAGDNAITEVYELGRELAGPRNWRHAYEPAHYSCHKDRWPPIGT